MFAKNGDSFHNWCNAKAKPIEKIIAAAHLGDLQLMHLFFYWLFKRLVRPERPSPTKIVKVAGYVQTSITKSLVHRGSRADINPC
jgi:hypothetical protein